MKVNVDIKEGGGKNKYLFILMIILFISLLVSSFFGLYYKNKYDNGWKLKNVKNEYKIVTDTIRDTIPIPYKVIVKGKQITKLPLAHPDTVYSGDSVNVDVPITQKTYKDSSYKVIISGYDPTLDSIEIYRKTIYQIKTITKFKERRWNIGPTIGYGMTPNGFHSFIGIGITYNLLK